MVANGIRQTGRMLLMDGGRGRRVLIEAVVGIHGTGYHDMHGDAPRGYARGVVVRRHVDEGYSARQAGFVGGEARQTGRGLSMGGKAR